MTSTAAPADTTMMRIVHDALRRDLGRARATLASHGTGAAQRVAVADHLRWLVRFLHAHHASEDAGLYPLAERRAAGDDAALAVFARMEADHRAIAPAAVEVDAAAAAVVDDPVDATATRAVAGIDQLSAVLLPHLQAEEDEAMTLVSQLVTASEWRAIEAEHNLDPKSTAELGFEGHWLIDAASDADRAAVLALVPPVQRFVLLHGFARRYRRHVAACWGTSPPTRRVQLANEVAVTVDADIDAVWEVVRDVTRVGEWSHECVGAAWVGGADRAVPGARFRGRNTSGIFRWGRECEVLRAEPHELVWRTVPTALYPDSSEWRITLTPDGAGTTITEAFEVVRGAKVLAVLYGLAVPAHRDRTAALEADLRRLGAVAAQRLRPTVRPGSPTG